jgi:DNA-binding transcriptional MocR family regulator
MAYTDLSQEELATLKSQLDQEYAAIKARGLKLNMARGKPSAEQLDLSMPMLDTVNASSSLAAEDGTDCRNYGVMEGIPEARRFMAAYMDDIPERVLVFGNSSLNIMSDLVLAGMLHGYLGEPAWKDLAEVKWLCPSPGYDRHFRITERVGMTLVPVAMTDEGPDMDEVERLVADDPAIKGIWCVPQYSNPTGIVYSDETVGRLASMRCAAEDFRIFWDNAYAVHHLYLTGDDGKEIVPHVADIAQACIDAGNPDRYFKFASTSKVTFPGAGISAVAASPANIAEIKHNVGAQTVGYDKINQLRHVRFLKDMDGVAAHMHKHAAIMRPKFELVEQKLSAGLEGVGASWTHPLGGYFVSFEGLPNTAKRTVELAKEAGVTLTGAGATWPYGRDPQDSNIRIAPSLPPVEELDQALDVFVCCVKLASVESLLK